MQAFHLSGRIARCRAGRGERARGEVHRRRHRPDAVAEGQCRVRNRLVDLEQVGLRDIEVDASGPAAWSDGAA